MSIQQLLNDGVITIDSSFSSAQRDKVIDALEILYQPNPTSGLPSKAMLFFDSIRNDPLGLTFSYEFQKAHAFTAENRVVLDPDQTFAMVNGIGNVVDAGLERIVLHEAVHAVEDILDTREILTGGEENVPISGAPDYAGPTVVRTNEMLSEFGYADRISYSGFDTLGNSRDFLTIGDELTFGNEIDTVLVTYSRTLPDGSNVATSPSGATTPGLNPDTQWNTVNVRDLVIDALDIDNQISTGVGDDYIYARGGQDFIFGSAGSNYIDGGGGIDGIYYGIDVPNAGEVSMGITVSIAAEITTVLNAYGGTDTLIGIEEINGTSYDDAFHLSGAFGLLDLQFNKFFADDIGNNETIGDTLILDLDSGVTADLSNGRISSGVFAVDLSGFENVVGTAFGDTITGNAGTNFLAGGSGADELRGGAGDDILIFDHADTVVSGGSGRDTAIISRSSGQEIDLSGIDVEVVIGSSGTDIFRATEGKTEALAGGAGNDVFIITEPYQPDPGEPEPDYEFPRSDGAPTIIWGGAGSDQIIYRGEDQFGVLAVSVGNLSESNFHLLDLDVFGLGPDFRWDLIDVVLVNPDSEDRLIIESPESVPEEHRSSRVWEHSDNTVLNINLTGGYEAFGNQTNHEGTEVSELDNAELIVGGPNDIDPDEGPEGPDRYFVETYSEAVSVSLPTGLGSYSTDTLGSRFTSVYTDGLNSILKRSTANTIEHASGSPDTVSYSYDFPFVEDEDEDGVLDTSAAVFEKKFGTVADDNVTRFETDYFWVGHRAFGADDYTLERPNDNEINVDLDVSSHFIAGGTLNEVGRVSTGIGVGNVSITLNSTDNDLSSFLELVGVSSNGNTSTGSTNVGAGSGVTAVSGFDPDSNIVGYVGNVFDPSNVTSSYTFSQVGQNVLIDFGGGDEIVLEEVNLVEWQAAASLQTLGTNASETISGSHDGGLIAAGSGDDTIYAGNQNDTIIYTSGDDVIVGNKKNKGVDTLDLKQYAADEVTFTVSGTHDVLIATPDGTIELDYQGRYALGHSRSNIEEITFSDSTLDAAGIMARALGDQATDGNDTIAGTLQSDTLNGGAGNDLLIGHQGADTFEFLSGDDVIMGNGTRNTGFDTLDLSQYNAADVSFSDEGSYDVLITTTDGTIELDYQTRYAVGHNYSNIEEIIFADAVLDEQGILDRVTNDLLI